MAASTAGRLELISTGPAQTFELARGLAGVARPGDLIGLWGELGAGKTTFAKGFGVGLGVVSTISSPSFILMAEHAGRLPLFHVDLYRLDEAADAFAGGLLDERQAGGVTLIEWPERLGPSLGRPRLDVRIDGLGDEPRRIELAAFGGGLERYLASARELAQRGAIEHRTPAADPSEGAA